MFLVLMTNEVSAINRKGTKAYLAEIYLHIYTGSHGAIKSLVETGLDMPAVCV